MDAPLDLTEWMERDSLAPVHDALQILHDEEHESDDPARLGAFAALIDASRQDPALAADLSRWLLRYVWQKPFPNYTRHAWRALQTIVRDPETLAADAERILRHHPHGELRAEVLVFHEARHPAYLESQPFITLMRALSMDDPSPSVRVGAWEFLEFAGVVGVGQLEQLLKVVQDDAAAEVRVVAMVFASGVRLPDAEQALAERRRQVQEQALQEPRNAWVLTRMLSAYLRTASIHSDPDRGAFALDLLAARPELPMRDDVLRTLSWQVPWGTQPHGVVAERWIRAAPYGSGAGLLEHLAGRVADPTAPADERVDAMHALFAFRAVDRVTLQQAVDLYLSPELGPAELVTWADATWLVRALFATPKPPIRQAEDRLGLLDLLLMRTRAFASEEKVAAASDAVRFIVHQAVRVAANPTMKPAAAQALLDAAVAGVARDPGDSSFGLYDLRDVPAALDLRGVAVAMAEASPSARDSTAAYLVIAYGRVPSDHRLQAAVAGIGLCSARFGILPLVRELPPRRDLPSDHAAQLAAALEVHLQDGQLGDWPREQVERWINAV